MAHKPLRRMNLKQGHSAFTDSMLHQVPLSEKSRFNSELLLSALQADILAHLSGKFNSKAVIEKFAAAELRNLTPIFSGIESAMEFFSSNKYLMPAKNNPPGKKSKKKMDAFALKTQTGLILSALDTAHSLAALEPTVSYDPPPLSETSRNQLKAFFAQVYAMRESLLATGSAISSTLKNFRQNSQTTYKSVELAKLADALKRLHAIQSSLAEHSPTFEIVYAPPARLAHEAKAVVPPLKERKSSGRAMEMRLRQFKKAAQNMAAEPALPRQAAEWAPPAQLPSEPAVAKQKADSSGGPAEGQAGIAATIAATVKNWSAYLLSHLPGSGSKKPPQGSF